MSKDLLYSTSLYALPYVKVDDVTPFERLSTPALTFLMAV